MSTTTDNNQSETVEQPVYDNADLKGRTDTTWSDMDKEERHARFTAPHKGITEDAVLEAWDAKHSTNGVAKVLGCSRPNARRWLLKLGLVEPTPAELARQAAKDTKKGATKTAPKPTETEIVAEQIAMDIATAIEGLDE